MNQGDKQTIKSKGKQNSSVDEDIFGIDSLLINSHFRNP